jgi:hypothetical protein
MKSSSEASFLSSISERKEKEKKNQAAYSVHSSIVKQKNKIERKFHFERFHGR